jgi:hypothetical protein
LYALVLTAIQLITVIVKWEYKYAKVKDEELEKTVPILNALGKDGWEFTGHTEDTGYATIYLMKRVRSD